MSPSSRIQTCFGGGYCCGSFLFLFFGFMCITVKVILIPPELWVGCLLSSERKLKHQQGTSTGGRGVGGGGREWK